jgi:hypothetical protein
MAATTAFATAVESDLRGGDERWLMGAVTSGRSGQEPGRAGAVDLRTVDHVHVPSTKA